MDARGRVIEKGYAWRGCLCGLACVALIGCDELPQADPPTVKALEIRPVEAVSHITAPLDDRGLVDYLKAANDRHAKGVTAGNNWEVAVRHAVGPGTMDDETRAIYYQLLGVPEPGSPPPEGSRFTPLVGAARVQFAQLTGSWVEEDFPELAEWLRHNGQSLDGLAECSRRTHGYLPYIATAPGYQETLETLRGRYGEASAVARDVIVKELVSGLHGNSGPLTRHHPLTLHLLNAHKDIARGFFARAMLRLGQSDFAAAGSDLLALHRLARLTSQGMLPEWVAASSLEELAARGEAAMLASGAISATDAEEYLNALTALPTLVPVAETIDIDDRHMALDAMQFAAANARLTLSELEKFQDDQIDLVAAIIEAIDWNLALRKLNAKYDQLVAAAREAGPARRQAALDAMRRTRVDFETWSGAGLAVELEKAVASNADELAQWLADVYFVRSATPGVIGLDTEARTRRDVIRAGFAVHLYRLEKGRLPEKLDDLTPRLRKIPVDGFTGKPLQVRSSPNGLLVWSVGRNGVDDHGGAAAEDPQADDIRILVR